MAKISKTLAAGMARTLTRHKLDAKGLALVEESAALFKAVYDDVHDTEMKVLMARLLEKHPGCFNTHGCVYAQVEGMRVTLGSAYRGIGNYEVSWRTETEELHWIAGTHVAPQDPALRERIKAFALAAVNFGDEVGATYERAHAAIRVFGTTERMRKEWPEVMSLFEPLLPSGEKVSLPVVQVEALNDEFGLPPETAAA